MVTEAFTWNVTVLSPGVTWNTGTAAGAWAPAGVVNRPHAARHKRPTDTPTTCLAECIARLPYGNICVSGHCRYATALHGQYRGRTASQHQHSRDSETLHSRETVRELLTHSDNDPLQAPAGIPWLGTRSVRSHTVRAATRPLSATRRLQPRLAPATTDLGVLMGIRIGQRVGRLLQIRHQVIR